MPESINSRSERYLRFSHRTLIALLILTVGVGGGCVVMAFNPGEAPRSVRSVGEVLGVVGFIALITLQGLTLKGERWNPNSPEVQAVLQDEWRRASMDRAMRVAFTVVLVAQIPIALLVAQLPSLRAVMTMAIATLTLGVATLIALFLFFGREGQNE